MLNFKQTNLKPLIESKDGVHLTVYLVNRGDLIDLKSQLRISMKEACDICKSVRKILKNESEMNLEKSLLEFRFAEEEGRVKKNIFQISKAVIQGRVRKLIVTDELNIFGKIDLKTGGLAIHALDLDHEDDCILDDLVQIVLSQGGQVIVAKRDEIPKGRPILAILDDGSELEKLEELQCEAIQERFG